MYFVDWWVDGDYEILFTLARMLPLFVVGSIAGRKTLVLIMFM